MKAALTLIDIAALSPLLILLAGALFLLILESFAEIAARKYSFYLAFSAITAALIATIAAPMSQNPLLTPWLRFDSLALIFEVLFLSIGLASTLLAAAFFQRFETTRSEYYFLIISALFGLMLIGASADFLTLFLGMETLSISVYVLCGYMKKWNLSNEASLKYFLMGTIAAAIFLYGIAMIYGAIGTTRLDALLQAYMTLAANANKMLFLGGIALITIGLSFKAAIFPFHIWAPDTYDGAPTPVTAFMSVGTKAGAFAAFVLVFTISLPNFNTIWNDSIALIAYPTMIYANLVALRQVQLRRFFAYSSISHSGFLLIPLAAGTPEAISALVFYLVIYGLATFGSFGILALLDKQESGPFLHDLHGLFKRSPTLAFVLSGFLLTLAGIPPTAGFLAKFYVFKVGFEAGYYGLVVVGLLVAILSAYYYLRIIALIFSEEPIEQDPPTGMWPATVVGIVSLVAIIILSCYPAPLFNLQS